MQTFVRRPTRLPLVSLPLVTFFLMLCTPQLFAQQYNFGDVASVPADGSFEYCNYAYEELETAQDETSTGPFSCGWPPAINSGQCVYVPAQFDPSTAGTYSGSSPSNTISQQPVIM